MTLRDTCRSLRHRAHALAMAASVLAAPWTMTAAHGTEPMQFVGDLRLIANNTLTGSVSLDAVLARPGIYGLGMLEGLSGELLILDSKATLGAYQDQTYAVTPVQHGRIAFAVIAHVPRWSAVRVPDTVVSFKDLETFVATTASGAGIDVEKPFPFRLDGRATTLKWFVVNGMGNLKPSPRDSFVRQMRRGGLDDVSFEGFGLHSKAHRGIYTNLVSNIHLHFRTEQRSGKPFVAHLDDDIALEPGATLHLPAR